MGAVRSTRFLRCSGKSEAYMALIVPPMQYPSSVNSSEPERRRTLLTALGRGARGGSGAPGAAQSVPEQRELVRAGVAQDLLYRPGQVVEDVVLEVEVLVLIARYAPVEHVDVEALLGQELDKAVARHEVQDVRAVDEGVDHEDRDRVLLLDGGRVMVELRLVLGPDGLLGRLAGVGLGALDHDLHPAAVLVEKG